MKTLKEVILCTVAVLSMWGLAARGAVTFVGNDFTTGSEWRNPGVIKPDDIDGDNVYGSDGYFLPGVKLFGYVNPLLVGTNVITTDPNSVDALPSYVVDLEFANPESGSTWGGGPSSDDGMMDTVPGNLGYTSCLVPSLATTTNLNLTLRCTNAPAFRLTLIFGNDPNALGFFETSATGGNTNIPNLDDPLGMYVTVNDGSGAVSQLSGNSSLAGATNGFTTYQSWDISAGSTNISITIGLNGTTNTVPRLSGIAIDALPITAPTVLIPPIGGTIYQGHPILLTVTAGGAGIGYQWLFNSNSIAGATNWEYQISSAATTNSGNYQVLITNSVGSVTSTVAAINVLAPPTTILYQDAFSGSGALSGRHPDTAGTNATWVASAIWNTDGTEMTATGVATGNAFLPFTPQPGRVYTLSATIQDTTLDGGSWTAMGFANGNNVGNQWHTVNSPVGWTLVRGNYPAGNSGNLNQTFIGPGTAGGSGAFYPTNFTTYQVILDTTPAAPANWTFTFTENGNVLRTATKFGGSGPTISEVGIGLIDGGSGSSGAAADVQNFTLSQQVPFSAPFFTTQPVGGTNFVGETRTFSVVVGGSDPLTYQWQKNSNNIPNATNSVLILTNLQTTDSGSYRVIAANPLLPGGTNSFNALITVVTPVVSTIYEDNFTADSGGILNSNTPDTIGASTWTANPAWGSDGTEAVVNSAASANAFLPFVPQAGHVYTLAANIDCQSGNWIALGFANGNVTNVNWQNTGSGANTPVGWGLARPDGSGQDNQVFVGPGTAGGADTGFSPTGGMHNYAVILDTRPATSNAWTFTFQMDSNTLAGPTAFGGSGPAISEVGLGAFASSSGLVQNFTLTVATASSGVSTLRINKHGGAVVVSWPISGPGTLNASPTLGAGASWQPVGGTPTAVNGTNQMTIPITNSTQFYRLQ